MKSLNLLILRNNNISGSIPSNIGDYQRLLQLDFSFNKLTGQIPDSLFNLSSLSYLFLGNNKLTGILPAQKSTPLLNMIYVPEGHPLKCEPNEPLRVDVLYQHIQKIPSSDSVVIAETGDSWFNCQKLKLPEGCGYEFQMQYGSIGWVVGATLGYAQAARNKRVIASIGGGSFQVTAQDVSTMLRCE